MFLADPVASLTAYLCQGQSMMIRNLECNKGILKLKSVTVYTAPAENAKSCDTSRPRSGLEKVENCVRTIHSKLLILKVTRFTSCKRRFMIALAKSHISVLSNLSKIQSHSNFL